MTENKRFTLSEDKYNETIFNNGKAMGIIDVVEKLNEINEENKELKLLLREVEHELTFLTGLSATDSTSIVKEDMEKYCLFRLDYTELLKKIDKVI